MMASITHKKFLKIFVILNRNFQDVARAIYIITDHGFIKSKKCYKDTCQELKVKAKLLSVALQKIIHADMYFLHKNCEFS